MTSYITIANTEVDPDSPITADLMTKLRDNPIAISEGSSGAPINQAEWHFYDRTTVGGSGTGVIYDFAVSGAVSTITSPDFVDGYEYRFWFDGVSINTAASYAYRVAFYRETSAAYSGTTTILSPAGASSAAFIDLTIDAPRVVRNTHIFDTKAVEWTGSPSNANLTSTASSFGLQSSTAQKLLRLQFSLAAGNLDAGKVYMFRRRVAQ